MGTMGTKLSTSVRNSSANEANGSPSTTSTSNFGILGHGQRTGTSAADARQRTRSLTSVLHVNRTSSQPLGIPSGPGAILGGPGSPDSETSTPDDASFNRVFAAHSLPAQLMSLNVQLLTFYFWTPVNHQELVKATLTNSCINLSFINPILSLVSTMEAGNWTGLPPRIDSIVRPLQDLHHR
ncbi:uncharacterized protein LOC143243739 [Tachypleus tridentatus]|uniref:uncharacterized protein LOC143243739 n=1 Tax=Tachypleus tridentatus TaxID=6853 RepID=UPI003FD07127